MNLKMSGNEVEIWKWVEMKSKSWNHKLTDSLKTEYTPTHPYFVCGGSVVGGGGGQIWPRGTDPAKKGNLPSSFEQIW